MKFATFGLFPTTIFQPEHQNHSSTLALIDDVHTNYCVISLIQTMNLTITTISPFQG